MSFKTKQFSIKDLDFWIENPRINKHLKSIEEVITYFTEGKEKEKTKGMLKDFISTNRLNEPLYLLEGETVVYEGNRRLVALKLLQDSKLAPSLEIWVNNQNKDNFIPIDKVNCLVYDNKEQLLDAIGGRHNGEEGGQGLRSWESLEKDKFKVYRGKSLNNPHAYVFVQTALNELDIDPTTPYTTLERIFSQKQCVKENLMLTFDKDNWELKFDYSKEALLNLIKTLNNSGVTSRDINTSKAIQSFIKKKLAPSLKKYSKTDLPFSYKVAKPTVSHIDPRNSKHEDKNNSDNKPSLNKNTFLPSDFTPSSGIKRIDDIGIELHKLNVKKFINAAATCFRAYIDLLTYEAYKRIQTDNTNKNIPLNKRLSELYNFLVKKTPDQKYKLKSVKNATNSKDNILTTETLNAYMHNPDYSPKLEDLENYAQEFLYFITALEKIIKDNI